MEAILYRITLWSFFTGMAAHFLGLYPKERTPAARWFLTMAAFFVFIGFASLTATIVSRWIAQGRIPISSSYEYLSVLAWFVAVFYFVVMYRVKGSSFLGACISPGLFLAVVFAGLYPQRLEMTLVPALQSYWLKIHVTMTIIGEAVFALAFIMGLLYLIKNCRWGEIGKGVKKGSVNILLLSMVLGMAVLAILRTWGLVLTGLGGFRLLVSVIGAGFLVAVPLYLFAWRRWFPENTSGFGGLIFALTVLSLMSSGMFLASVVNRNRSQMEELVSRIRAVEELTRELDSRKTSLTAEAWELFIGVKKQKFALFQALEKLQAEKKHSLTSEEADPLLAGSLLAGQLSFPLSLGEIREERYSLGNNIAALEDIVRELGFPAELSSLDNLRSFLIERYNRLFTADFLPPESGRESAFIGFMVLLAVPLFVLFYVLARRLKDRIPALERLDSLAYRSVSLGFPIFTFGALISGAIWAHYAWGKWWSNDPKEIGSLIVWLVYLIYLHARYVRKWSGNQAAVAAILGFLFAVLSFVGNSILGGLHSYG